MNKILIATTNQGKIRELKRILAEYIEIYHCNINVLTLNDFSKPEEPLENGSTFEENAVIKAKYYYELFKIPVICDDSGLEVDAINKKPGIFSARYASYNGKDASAKDNCEKLLRDLKEIKNRSARFCCAMVYYDGNNTFCATGYTEGKILDREIGTNGFGYDPIFYSTEAEKPMGLIDDKTKDLISHRGKAFKKLINAIINNKKNVN